MIKSFLVLTLLPFLVYWLSWTIRVQSQRGSGLSCPLAFTNMTLTKVRFASQCPHQSRPAPSWAPFLPRAATRVDHPVNVRCIADRRSRYPHHASYATRSPGGLSMHVALYRRSITVNWLAFYLRRACSSLSACRSMHSQMLVSRNLRTALILNTVKVGLGWERCYMDRSQHNAYLEGSWVMYFVFRKGGWCVAWIDGRIAFARLREPLRQVVLLTVCRARTVQQQTSLFSSKAGERRVSHSTRVSVSNSRDRWPLDCYYYGE